MQMRFWLPTLLIALIALPALASTPCSAPEQNDTTADLLAQILKQGPETVGEEIRLSFRSPALQGAKTESTGPIWTQVIQDPGGSYIAPYFGHMNLPEGARVVVRAPDGSRSWTYTGTGKGELGLKDGFWGIHIHGDTAIVELYSKVPVARNAVVIDSYARGYDYVPAGLPESLCGTDDSEWAKCYQTTEATAYNESQAVARLLIGGTSACTGWLLGDQGHLMTNEHCITSASQASNTDYEFNAEGGTCSTNCASFGGCPGTIVATSATFIQDSASLDYALVQLPVNPSGTYGFMQMRGSGPTLGERIYIPQHAAAWGKRIGIFSTHNSDSGFCQVNSVNETACSGGSSDVGYFCDTQGGSSGSPVLGYGDNLVIALHHCRGNSACTGSGGDPNRGVPVTAIIADLGANVPNNAVVGGGPPPPPPCKAKGSSCSANSECCSNKCKGRTGNKTCK